MFEKQETINEIIDRLSTLKSKVELSNALNLTDVNVISENFYRDFLNLIYGYDLKNINIVEPNAASIDLGDAGRRIAIQVTSTPTLAKTRKTVNSFIEKNLNLSYDRLIILNIKSKSRHQDSKIGSSGVFEIDTENDIWDITNLVKDISDKSTVELQQIVDFLRLEIKFQNSENLPKEVKTFLSLIQLLSNESHVSAGNGYIDEPDPNGKINERFANHADYLKSEFQSLYTEYGEVLSDVETQSDLGHAKIRRLGFHLKSTSDQELRECGGNPVIALNNLIEKYGSILGKANVDYDASAIKFYLVDQLIKCNVFPNRAAIDV